MIQTSEQIDAISAALAKAQVEIENVEATGTNPAFKRGGKESRYATLGGVLDEVRPKLAAQGISVVQMAVNGEGSNIGIATRLLHSSGQWIESTLYVAPQQFTAQGAGSVITYLRRYCLMAMTGIAPEDDDGNAASLGAPAAREAPRAGMVRSADVPQTDAALKRALVRSSEPIANGNGNGFDKRKLAERFRDDMKGHFAKAKTPDDVRKLMADTRSDLEAVHKDAPDVYAEIVTAANNATNAMYGETG